MLSQIFRLLLSRLIPVDGVDVYRENAKDRLNDSFPNWVIKKSRDQYSFRDRLQNEE